MPTSARGSVVTVRGMYSQRRDDVGIVPYGGIRSVKTVIARKTDCHGRRCRPRNDRGCGIRCGCGRRDTRPRVSGVAGLRYGRTPQERCPYGGVRDVGGVRRDFEGAVPYGQKRPPGRAPGVGFDCVLTATAAGLRVYASGAGSGVTGAVTSFRTFSAVASTVSAVLVGLKQPATAAALSEASVMT